METRYDLLSTDCSVIDLDEVEGKAAILSNKFRSKRFEDSTRADSSVSYRSDSIIRRVLNLILWRRRLAQKCKTSQRR